MSESNTLVQSDIGDVRIITTDGRGFSPEELTEQALDKIIYVGRNSHPAIIAQAHAFRENIRGVLEEFFKTAQAEERSNIYGKLVMNGYEELADLIRRL